MEYLIIKIVKKFRPRILAIVDYFPSWFQNMLKGFYRQLLSKDLYKITLDKKEVSSFKKGKYSYPSHIDPDYPKGINLIGFPRTESGLGQHLRSVGNSIESGKIKHLYYGCEDLFALNSGDNSVADKIEDKLKYNTNIFVCNGDAIATLYKEISKDIFAKRYNINYGAWELRKYPEEWTRTLGLCDEFWAMSSFLQNAVADSAKIPVIHMPYPVDFVVDETIKRSHFGLPEDKFLYIFTFDMSSLAERKNPHAVIKAFLGAFPDNQDVGLVIKASSKKDSLTQKKQIAEIMLLAKNDPRIYLIDKILPRNEILGLINSADVYVSLHRAEGFGIGMAEAMKMGKPVIATNYSGNIDFTLPDNSCLVDYKLVDIKPMEYIYEKGKVWAEPSVEHASYYMKKLFEDRDYYKTLSIKGKAFIDENYNVNVVKGKYLERLKILGLI